MNLVSLKESLLTDYYSYLEPEVVSVIGSQADYREKAKKIVTIQPASIDEAAKLK